MRKSRYTIEAVGKGGEHLLYNTAYGTFAELDEQALEDYRTCSGANVAELADAGFLTEMSDEEELEAQRELFCAQRRQTAELVLSIVPTYACNFRCPYCYELGHNSIKGKMKPYVVEAILKFVEGRHESIGFEQLSVQWYGGDPSLALDVVENLSEKLIAWCDSTGVRYSAMMLTNCNLVDESAVDMLVHARVDCVMITIDGFEETHNKRRVSATGSNSFKRNVEAAKMFAERGVRVLANMNADRVNWPEYYDLKKYLKEEAGIELTFGRLCDYGKFYGTRDFKAPEFDLFDSEEFDAKTYEAFSREGHGAQDIVERLKPVPRFCSGQMNEYYIVDTLGDVYTCDGVIGEREHVSFNILDDPSTFELERVSHDPHESAECASCNIMPICQGNCDWERRASDMKCHPLKTTMDLYLGDLRACYGAADKPVTRFV